jgi:hypothetical protein
MVSWRISRFASNFNAELAGAANMHGRSTIWAQGHIPRESACKGKGLAARLIGQPPFLSFRI